MGRDKRRGLILPGSVGFAFVGFASVGFGVVGFGVVGFGVVGFGVVGFGVVGFGVVGFVGFGFVRFVLQALIPSFHVCSNLLSPVLCPHFWYHEPPMPQQVGFLRMKTHLEHSERKRDLFVLRMIMQAYYHECAQVCGGQLA